MSGLAKGLKKAVKSVGRWISKNWVKIVIAAAIIFTAGIATVGVAGFSGAAAAAGGGFAGTMSAVGSTMVAGVSAIGGTFGIGSGVTASTAGGAFAAAPAVQGALAASGGAMGATLGTGAAAQAMGFAPEAARFAAGAAADGIGPNAAMAGGTVASAPNAVSVANGATQVAGGQMQAGGPAIASGASGAPAATGANQGGLMSRFANSNMAGPLLQAGIQGVTGYMQGRALDEQLDAERPRGFWGVDLRGDNSLTPDQMRGDGGPMWTSQSFEPPPGVPGLMNRQRMTPEQLAYMRRGGFNG